MRSCENLVADENLKEEVNWIDDHEEWFKFLSETIELTSETGAGKNINLIYKNYRILDLLKNLYLENCEDGEKKFKIEFQEALRNNGGDTTKALIRYVSFSELLLKK